MKKLFYVLLLPVLLAFTADQTQNDFYLPKQVTNIYAADFDRDGRIDIVTRHSTLYNATNPSLTFLKNETTGISIKDTACLFYDGSYEFGDLDFFAADMNNDGFPDVVTQHRVKTPTVEEAYLRIYYNDGTGSFPTFSDLNLSTHGIAGNYAHGDVNGDGFQDIVMTGQSTWGIYYNDGTGKLLPPEIRPFPEPGYYGIVCGDLNGDHKDDVVFINWDGEGKIVILYNPFDSIFEINQKVYELAIADMNQDGRNDLIISCPNPNGYSYSIAIYENQPGIFQEHLCGKISKRPHTLFVSDLDNDGLPDIVVTPYTPTYLRAAPLGILEICYNKGNFQMDETQYLELEYAFEKTTGESYCADFDNNGFTDIATIYHKHPLTYPYTERYGLHIFYNRGDRTFSETPLSKKESAQVANLNVYPSPFRDLVTFEFSTRQANRVELVIYNLQGELMERLAVPAKTENQKITWDGRHVKPGVYIVGIKIDGVLSKSIKITRL